MLYVRALYTDRSWQSQPLRNLGALSKVFVLAIFVRTSWRTGKEANISVAFGKDNYAVCYKYEGGSEKAMVIGWDTDDCGWRNEAGVREIVDMPLGILHTVFRGGSVPFDEWNNAIIPIINTEL